MIVDDVWADAVEVFGTCDEPVMYRRINDAIELLVSKGDWQPLFCYVDVCTSGGCAVLPSDVETPLAAIIDGVPALARHELYRYHLNGPGDRYRTARWEWEDGGLAATMRDLAVPSKLVARLDRPEDSGTLLWVYGYDKVGALVRTHQPDGSFVDGYQVPTMFGWSLPDSAAPEFARITGVRKAKTVGRVRLATVDWNPMTHEGDLLGDYQPNELEPSYRRVRLSACSSHVRFYVRRKTFRVASRTDFIPLHHGFALRLGMQSIRAYIDRDAGLGMDFESQAVRLLSERESAVTPPGGLAMQFDPGALTPETLEGY